MVSLAEYTTQRNNRMNDNNIVLIKQLAQLLEQAQIHVSPGSVLYADILRAIQTAKRRVASNERN